MLKPVHVTRRQGKTVGPFSRSASQPLRHLVRIAPPPQLKSLGSRLNPVDARDRVTALAASPPDYRTAPMHPIMRPLLRAWSQRLTRHHRPPNLQQRSAITTLRR